MSLSERIFHGDIKAASRLMRDIDDEMESAIDELKALYAKTGRAHIVGITGPPGRQKHPHRQDNRGLQSRNEDGGGYCG